MPVGDVSNVTLEMTITNNGIVFLEAEVVNEYGETIHFMAISESIE